MSYFTSKLFRSTSFFFKIAIKREFFHFHDFGAFNSWLYCMELSHCSSFSVSGLQDICSGICFGGGCTFSYEINGITVQRMTYIQSYRSRPFVIILGQEDFCENIYFHLFLRMFIFLFHPVFLYLIYQITFIFCSRLYNHVRIFIL